MCQRRGWNVGAIMSDPWPWLLPIGVVLAWLALTRLGKVSRAKAHELVSSGALLVDVRTETEFASGHLNGAISMPLARLSEGAPSLREKHKPIVVYCASGIRSGAARRVLRRVGVEEVYDLGAMSRW